MHFDGRDEFHQWSERIQKQGLLVALKEAKGNGRDPKINFIPTALIYACFNYLSEGERGKIKIMKYLNAIPVDPPLSPEIMQKEPFNNKDFIIRLFMNVQSNLVASQEDQSQFRGQTSFFFARINVLASTDMHNYLMSYYISLIKQRKPLYFGQSADAPIFWNSFFDFSLIKDRNIDTTINKVKHMYPDLKSLQIDKAQIKTRRSILKNELTNSIPKSFYSTDYIMNDDEFINQYQSDVETMQRKHIQSLIRAMYLILPNPFDNIGMRISNQTLFKYKIKTLQRYAEMIAQFTGYKIFNYSKSELQKELGWIPIDIRKELNSKMNFLAKAPKIQPNSFEERVYEYVRQNGFISICGMKESFPQNFANIDSETLKKELFKERQLIKPCAPPGADPTIKRLEDIQEWMFKFDNVKKKIRISDIKKKLLEFSQNKNGSNYFSRIIPTDQQPIDSMCAMPLYINSIGRLDEKGYPRNYEAIRIINGHVIAIKITQKYFQIVVENDNHIVLEIFNASLVQCYINFLFKFYEMFKIKIEMKPTEFFGLDNEIYRAMLNQSTKKFIERIKLN